MIIKVNKVLTEQKKVMGVTNMAFGIEMCVSALILLVFNWILALLFLLIVHPIAVSLTKKDTLFIDIFFQNFDDPKELYF